MLAGGDAVGNGCVLLLIILLFYMRLVICFTLQQVWLPQPLLSPPEIFDLMRECWQKNPTDRPTFQHIHLFLEQKCNTTIYHAV